MFHSVIARIFVKRMTVELIKTVSILREMGGNPVEDNADSRRVKFVYEISEIVRRSET